MALVRSRKFLLVLVLLGEFSIDLCPAAAAQQRQTVEQLQAAGRLQVKSWLEPAQGIIVNQQINLVIEVATDRWFTGGTRIGRLEVNDAVVLQREQFAVNSTRREGGTTWSVQQWSINVYPQRRGDFDLAAVPLSVAVAGDDGKPVRGEIYTRPTSFVASLPEDLAALSSAKQPDATWIASPAFNVEETYSQSHARQLDKLQVGDAVQRTIAFKADNVAAMMLPAVKVREQQGLAIYQKPPRLADTVNRGIVQAQRVETIIYALEKSGDYVLPELTYYWWNLSTQTLQTVTLPEQRISTISAVTAAPESQAQQRTKYQWAVLIGKIGIPLLLLIVFLLVWRQRRRAAGATRRVNAERVLRKKLLQAVRLGDVQQSIGYLYQWLDHYQKNRFDGSIRSMLEDMHEQELLLMFERLMQRLYANSSDSPETEIERFVRAMDKALRNSRRTTHWRARPLSLELN